MALIVPSSFYGIDAGLHALSFSLGINVHRLCDVMSVICFLYFVEFCPRYLDGFRKT
jgi:hypothetical protein